MSQKIKILIFFLSLGIALAAIQIVPNGFLDFDGYYHVQMARLLASGHFLTTFPWLSSATWSASFADQHLLYHILLIPFIKINPIIGAQIFNVLAGTAFAYIFFLILRSQNIKHPKLWTLFCIFGSSVFLLRLSLVKATSISLFLIFLFIYFLLNNKAKSLFVVSLIFVWMYGGFVFLPVILALYFASAIINNMLVDKKLSLIKIKTIVGKNILYPLVGILLGVLIFPHWPSLVRELYNQIFHAGLNYQIPVGSEWSPPSIKDLVSENGFVLFIWLWALGWLFTKSRQFLKDGRLIFLLLLSLFFFALNLKSQRFAEESVPFMVLFSAFVFNLYLPEFLNNLKQHFTFKTRVAVILLFVTLVCIIKTQSVFEQMHKVAPLWRFTGAMEYLKSNSRPGEIVFNTNWDEFPGLFYLNPSNNYVVGMDPMFTYIKNPETYWFWNHISYDDTAFCNVKICTSSNSRSLETILKNDFKASYILFEKQPAPRLAAFLQNNPHFILGFEDSNLAVYKLAP